MAGFVYIVQADDTYRFKVGCSTNLSQRVRTLQLGSPTPLHLVGWFRVGNPYREESRWHRKLGTNRRHGEWFDLSLENLLRFVSTCNVFGRVDPVTPSFFDENVPYYFHWGEGFICPVRIEDLDREDPSMREVSPWASNEEGLIQFTWPKGHLKDPESLPCLLHESYLSLDPRGALLAQTQALDRPSELYHIQCNRVMQDARAIVDSRRSEGPYVSKTS